MARELSAYSGGESLVSKTMVGVEVALDHDLNQRTKIGSGPKESWININTTGLVNSHWTFRPIIEKSTED